MIITKKIIFVIVLTITIPSTIAIGVYTLNLLNQTDLSGDPEILPIILNGSLFENAPRDEVTFRNISLSGDKLILKISYSGGCQEHEFTLIGADVFMESHPVQTEIVLSHNANNDLCEALLMDILVFDLSPLKTAYQQDYSNSSGTIRIHLEGADSEIIYQF
ncbi:MAG: hypothetical protein ACFFAU_19765 [Candidatus Hodarchaeota archaeon]